MKWLKKKVLKWLNEPDYQKISVCTKDTDYIESNPVINFRIFSAQNGKILEFSKYDPVKDRNERSVYIIAKDEDLSEKVGKCLSLELLR